VLIIELEYVTEGTYGCFPFHNSIDTNIVLSLLFIERQER